MPVFELDERLLFPPVESADEDGILAFGGDLSVDRLVMAYSKGIFPWYEEGYPILWWSPDPRFILFPDELIISKSMKKILNKGIFKITYNMNFKDVIVNCSKPRKSESGTWITNDMIEAYCRLHELGIAHSVEVWHNGVLSGGLYGVALGKIFFGESMFSIESNASKTALIDLAKNLKNNGFLVIDSQVHTNHLESLGAKNIPRAQYLKILYKGISIKAPSPDFLKKTSHY